ncbi:MAG: hypothetical protein R8K53_09595 [Mariprofundaceae bacterium]
MLASWDGISLELWDATGARQAVFQSSDLQQPSTDAAINETVQEDVLPADSAFGDWSELDIDGVQAQASTLLLPCEILLQRSFSLPVEHPRFIDAAVLGQELDDQAGAESQDWWLCWQAMRSVGGEGGVRGLVFALPTALKTHLSNSEITASCREICPDICVRLQAHLPPDIESGAVLDVDVSGLMLGVVEDGVWRGMRRLNVQKSGAAADDALRSLCAMGFDADSMSVFGSLDADWLSCFHQLSEDSGANWHVQEIAELSSRHAANAAAFVRLHDDPPFNFRHDRWGLQSNWKKHLVMWQRTAVLGVFLALLLIGHDVYRMQQLSVQQQALRQGVEDTFHRALPGVAMIDPMLQLKQAAGGDVDSNVWFFLKQLEAIGKLQSKETGLMVQGIRYSGKDMLLSGMVTDFTMANRVRDGLSAILTRKVELVDTDLNGQQVRIRLRWF